MKIPFPSCYKSPIFDIEHGDVKFTMGSNVFMYSPEEIEWSFFHRNYHFSKQGKELNYPGEKKLDLYLNWILSLDAYLQLEWDHLNQNPVRDWEVYDYSNVEIFTICLESSDTLNVQFSLGLQDNSYFLEINNSVPKFGHLTFSPYELNIPFDESKHTITNYL